MNTFTPTSLHVTRFVLGSLGRIVPTAGAAVLERLFTLPGRHPVPARERDWMEGANVETVTLPDGRGLTSYSFGEGPTVLLAHGWSGRASQMGAFVAPLVDRGCRVVAFDQPGHGAGPRYRTSVPDFAVAIAGVARAVGPVHAVIAHSAGAAATTVALSRGMTAGRLVYLAPPDDVGDQLHRVQRDVGFSDAVADLAQRRVERRFGMRFDEVRGGELAQGQSVPLLVFHDPHDRRVAFSDSVRLVERWPGARLQPVPDVGHSRLVRDETTVAAAVQFVTYGMRTQS